MFMESYTNELIDRANELYDHKAPYYRYAGEFNLSELLILHEFCCNATSLGVCFEDEVRDALHLCYNYFDRHRKWLSKIS